MKHTYKQGVPPRLLALLNSPITTQENVEGTNIEPASGQEFNSKKVCLRDAQDLNPQARYVGAESRGEYREWCLNTAKARRGWWSTGGYLIYSSCAPRIVCSVRMGCPDGDRTGPLKY